MHHTLVTTAGQSRACTLQGAIGWVNGSSASFVELTLTSNKATSSGGGLYIQNCASGFTLADAEVTYNTAVENGGGVFVVRPISPRFLTTETATRSKRARAFM